MGKLRGRFTRKQRAFCREYLVDFNATRAAVRAGYSEVSAYCIGPKLVTKTHIAEWIDARMRDAAARAEVTPERIMRELALIGFANTRDYFRVVNGSIVLVLEELDRDHMAAVRELEIAPDGTVTFKLHDKQRALHTMAELLGMVKNRTELSTPPGQPLELAAVDGVELARLLAFAMSRLRKKAEGEAIEHQELEAAE